MSRVFPQDVFFLSAKVSHNTPAHNAPYKVHCVTSPHLGPVSHTNPRYNVFSPMFVRNTLANSKKCYAKNLQEQTQPPIFASYGPITDTRENNGIPNN